MSAYFIKATEFPMTVIYGDTPDGERKVKNLERGEVFEFDGWLHHAEQTPDTEGPSENAMAGSGYVQAPVNPAFVEALANLNKPVVQEPVTEVVADFSPIDPENKPESKPEVLNAEDEIDAVLAIEVINEVPAEEPAKPAPKKRGPKPKAKVETPAE